MKKLVQVFILVVVPQFIIALLIYSYQNLGTYKNLDVLKQEYSEKKVSRIIDHSKFKDLQGPFAKPQDITAACLTCHEQRGNELLSSHHFTWERAEYAPGKGVVYTGKKNAINNFCISMPSNEKSCNRCHAGYGWYDNTFDFSDPRNIDCLICHDNSFTYNRVSGTDEQPEFQIVIPDLQVILQNISSPQKENCGFCHFFGGGGNNVKHGDLEMALLSADKSLDIHMAKDGYDLSCVDCHKAENHKIKGRYYRIATSNQNRAYCNDCHGDFPHSDNLTNEHCIKVACQTCHIPTYAKANSTVMDWDYRTAGKLKDGKPYEIKDEDDNYTYLSIKGTFTRGKNLQPSYVWFNGTANQHLMTDKITEVPLSMNTLYGEYRDRDAKIIPVKINTGHQPYDIENNTLVNIKLYDKKGMGAFRQELNMDTAIIVGMEYLGLPYSGKYGYVETKNHMLINHMVAPKSEALSCNECHTRNNSRLAGLTDFYMPGRDRNNFINTFGRLLIIFSFIGVAVHALLRVVSFYNRRNKQI